MDMREGHGNIRNSAEQSITPERGNYYDENNLRNYPQNIPYPYYYGYRIPPNRMQPYPPYPPPPSMSMGPETNKETKNQSSETNKQSGYYPYQFPYHNSWFPPYIMHPQMMK